MPWSSAAALRPTRPSARRVYGEAYPIDEDFLAALEAMPESAGIALGVDRLVMLATGAERIEDVLYLPVGWTYPSPAPSRSGGRDRTPRR